MPYRLSGMRLNRVDLVPDGANPDAFIVLFKSHNKEDHVPAPKKKVPAKKAAPKKTATKKTAKPDTRKKSKQRGAADEEEEDEDIDKSLNDDDEDDDLEDDEEEEVEKSDDDDEDDEDDEADEEDDDEDDDVEKGSKNKKKTPAKKTKKVKKTVADDDDDEDDDADDGADDVEEIDETVMKSLPVAVQKQIRASQKIAKRALELATIEKDKRVTLEFIEKAKKDIPNLTGTHEEKGELLKALYAGVSEKVAKAIVKLLKSGDAAIRNLLMSETGKSRRVTKNGDDDSAISALEDKRDEILKAEPKLTKEAAMAKAVEQNPDLYTQYRLEKRRERRHQDEE